MAGLADQMEVAGLAVRVLEPEAPLPEINLAGDPGVYHPLQRTVDRGSADALILSTNDVDQIVCAQVTFLTQEYVDDLFPLARTFATDWLETREIRQGGRHA
jgi:hypothetical protein